MIRIYDGQKYTDLDQPDARPLSSVVGAFDGDGKGFILAEVVRAFKARKASLSLEIRLEPEHDGQHEIVVQCAEVVNAPGALTLNLVPEEIGPGAAILRDLAAGPPPVSDGDRCLLCGFCVPVPDGGFGPTFATLDSGTRVVVTRAYAVDSSSHPASCPWRRAVEWAEAQEPHAPILTAADIGAVTDRLVPSMKATLESPSFLLSDLDQA